MLNNIGIIGEGKMGTNLLYYLLDMDFNLTWVCSPLADQERLRRIIYKRLSRTLEAGIIDENRCQSILEKLIITNEPAELSSCELIIEAISENLEAKQQLFLSLDSIVNHDCILTSNSSSIIPSALLPSEKRKDKFAGLHFFYPVALKDIVEVTLTSETSMDTIQTIISFLKHIRRRYILLQENDSFILNRIFLHFQNEAFLLVNSKKASIQQIDRIVRERFFPTGVFDFFDSVGLDTILASVKNYSHGDPEEDNYRPLIGQLQELISAGRLGTKTKGGFYGDDILFDPGYPENEIEIIDKLQDAYKNAFRKFCRSSHIPAEELKLAMDEYFGSETPAIS